MFFRLQMIALAVAVGFTGPALAGDAYYSIPIQELKLVEGRLPDRIENTNWRHIERSQAMQPYAAVDGQADAYVVGPNNAPPEVGTGPTCLKPKFTFAPRRGRT